MTTHAVPRQGSVPSIVPILNRLIRRLLRGGLPLGPNVLLTVRGRTSGQPRTFPVALLKTGARRFVQSPFGEVNWTRNLRAAGAAVLTMSGRQERVVARELTAEQAAPIMREAFAPYLASRFGAAFLGRFYDLDRESSLADYEREAGAHPVFELLAERPELADAGEAERAE